MKVPQFMPHFGKEEEDAVLAVLRSGWITEGPVTKQFAEDLREITGAGYLVFAPNGTLALYCGLRALKEIYNYTNWDGVLVPDFTFIASATSILMNDLTPHFVDINPNTLQMSLASCKKIFHKAKKSGAKIRAIMPVHIYGHAANMTEIVDFAQENKLQIIEDAAQAVGVRWNDQHCGTFGDVGCFSTFADKTISTAEGGFIITDSEEIYQKLLYMRNQGRLLRGSFQHREIGQNFRITDIHAALGVSQLKKLPKIIGRKLDILSLYKALLSEVKQVKLVLNHLHSNIVPFRVCIEIDGPAQDLSDVMREREIETRTFFYPLHKQPCFEGMSCWNDRASRIDLSDESFPNSIHAFEHGLCLPSFVDLKNEQIDYVCSVIRDYYHVR
jgi:perosamine synthetase